MNTQKTTIMPEKVTFYSKDKEGKEYINKWGKPYIRAKIDAVGKSIYINIFNPEQKEMVMVGKALELEVEQNGQYLNYSIPKKKTAEEERIDKLEARIQILEDIIHGGNQHEPEIGGHVEDMPDEVKASDLPF